MNISEMIQGDKIHITVQRLEEVLHYEATVAAVEDNSIIVWSFTGKNDVIDYSEQGISIDLLLIRRNMSPYMWRGVRIDRCECDGTAGYRVTSSITGIKINRRGAFRLYLGDNATLVAGSDANHLDVIVKDISNNGFSVIVSKNGKIELQMDTRIEIRFEDKKLETSFDISGKIVRMQEYGNYLLLGCQTEQTYPQINRFIMEHAPEGAI